MKTARADTAVLAPCGHDAGRTHQVGDPPTATRAHKRRPPLLGPCVRLCSTGTIQSGQTNLALLLLDGIHEYPGHEMKMCQNDSIPQGICRSGLWDGPVPAERRSPPEPFVRQNAHPVRVLWFPILSQRTSPRVSHLGFRGVATSSPTPQFVHDRPRPAGGWERSSSEGAWGRPRKPNSSRDPIAAAYSSRARASSSSG